MKYTVVQGEKSLNSWVCCHLSVILPECDAKPRVARFLELLYFNLGQSRVPFKYSCSNIRAEAGKTDSFWVLERRFEVKKIGGENWRRWKSLHKLSMYQGIMVGGE